MAWNPSPEVAVARDFGKKFGYSHVLIIGINPGADTFGVVTYGENRKLCAQAKEWGDKIIKFIQDRPLSYLISMASARKGPPETVSL